MGEYVQSETVDLRGARTFVLEPFAVALQQNATQNTRAPDSVSAVQQVQKTAALDSASAAFADFSTYALATESSAEEARKAATYFDECLTYAFKNAASLKLRAFRPDAVLSGAIVDFSHNIVQNADFTAYARAVSLTVTYRVVSKTGAVLAVRSASTGGTSDFAADPQLLPPPYSVIEVKIPMLAQTVLEDLSNDDASRRVSLIAYKRGKTMRTAYKRFQKGEYTAAKELYLRVYADSRLFEAGYNAARIMQIKGELTEARALMNELFLRHKDKRAALALRDIDRVLNERRNKTSSLQSDGGSALKSAADNVAFFPFGF